MLTTMRIVVHAKAKSRQRKIEKVDEGMYRVWVHAAPEKGKANDEILEVIAKYFEVARSRVRIVIGKTAREKLVEIDR